MQLADVGVERVQADVEQLELENRESSWETWGQKRYRLMLNGVKGLDWKNRSRRGGEGIS